VRPIRESDALHDYKADSADLRRDYFAWHGAGGAKVLISATVLNLAQSYALLLPVLRLPSEARRRQFEREVRYRRASPPQC